MEKRQVALIGACGHEWVDKLLELSEDGKKIIGMSWAGPVVARHSHEEELLLQQIHDIGHFKFYFYLTRRLTGVGRVEYVAIVSEAKFLTEAKKSPFTQETPKEFSARKGKQRFKICSIKRLSRSLDLQDFECINHSVIENQTLRKGFAYVLDIPSSLIAFDTYHVVDFSKETYLEQLLADNPEVLEKGQLELVARQKNTQKGKIDLIFRQGTKAIFIVEVKNEKLSDSGIIQLKDYMSWAQKEYAGKSIHGILVCQSVSRRQRDVISQDRKNGCDIEARTYECGLRLIYN